MPDVKVLLFVLQAVNADQAPSGTMNVVIECTKSINLSSLS